jgi:hypothetical protein
VNNVTITLSDEQTIKKVVDLYRFYNFVVDDFFSWNDLVSQNVVWSSQTLKFKFQIVQTEPDGEMTKTKVVDFIGFYNFIVDDFSFEWFTVSKYYLNSSYFENPNLNCWSKVGWRNDQNKSCRSWWVLQFVVDSFFIWIYA